MADDPLRYQQALLRVVQGRPVAFYSAYAHALGSVTAALLLSQLCYWADKGHDGDGWIYKTQAELKDETGLSREEQETARRKLRKAGVLAEKKAGVPARLYFRVDFEALVDLLAQDAGIPHPSLRESATQADGNPASIHTETTSQMTGEGLAAVWAEALTHLRPSMSAPNFATWFEGTALVDLGHGTATVQAATYQQQGLARLERQLCRALSDASGQSITHCRTRPRP